MSKLNLKAIAGAKIRKAPFTWAEFSNIWSDKSTAQKLAAEFPTENFNVREYLDGFYLRRVLVPLGGTGVINEYSLSKAWVDLGHEIAGKAFRSAAEKISGLDLKASPIEAVLFRGGSFTSYADHVDAGSVTMRIVVYFNEQWKPEWGGLFQVLEGKNRNVVAEVTPKLGKAIAVIASNVEDTPHNVSPVAKTVPLTRNTLVISFHKPGTVSSRQ